MTLSCRIQCLGTVGEGQEMARSCRRASCEIRLRKRWSFILVLSLFTVAPLHAQPITFPTSMSVGDKDLFVRIQPWYIHAAEGSGESGRTLSEWNIRVMEIYGITRETTLFVAAPFIDRE